MSPDDASAAPAIAQELSRARGETIRALVTTVENGPLIPAVAERVIHQLAPGETTGSVSRFMDYWHPDVGIVLGVPDRPNLIHAARDRGIPLFLAAPNRGSLGIHRRLSYLSASLLGQFDMCLAASAADAAVLQRHFDDGIKIAVTGPLSDTTFALPCSETERDATAAILKGRPVWLAADISDREVDALDAAQRWALRSSHRLLLVVVPRDLSLGPAIAAALHSRGWQVGLRSAGDDPVEAVQVFVADTPEELGLWYRLAPISFVGGTLFDTGQQSDPYAAAALGSAVLHGPYTGENKSRFERLAAGGASVAVTDADSLGKAVQSLLAPDRAAMLAEAGWRVTTESAHVVEKLTELIGLALDEREGKR